MGRADYSALVAPGAAVRTNRRPVSGELLFRIPEAVPEKSFRAQRLYDVDAGGACGWEHRSDYRRA
jgi:hypothetical protein